MNTLKAVTFTDQEQLQQEIADLKVLDDREYAIIAKFQAEDVNGQLYELSCFVERQGSNFGIAGVIENDQNVDTSLLEFELLHHTVC